MGADATQPAAGSVTLTCAHKDRDCPGRHFGLSSRSLEAAPRRFRMPACPTSTPSPSSAVGSLLAMPIKQACSTKSGSSWTRTTLPRAVDSHLQSVWISLLEEPQIPMIRRSREGRNPAKSRYRIPALAGMTGFSSSLGSIHVQFLTRFRTATIDS